MQRSQSILVGSPDTIYERLRDLLKVAPVGNLLMQFHLGNMDNAFARKSMHLFATQVAPRLREDSIRIFGEKYPYLADARTAEVVK